MAEPEPGILAIWNDCRAGREAEFEAWFQGEHLLERLAVPGFLFAIFLIVFCSGGGTRQVPATPATSISILWTHQAFSPRSPISKGWTIRHR